MFSLRSNSIADRFALSLGAVFADLVHNFKTKMMDSLRSLVFLCSLLSIQMQSASVRSLRHALSLSFKGWRELVIREKDALRANLSVRS